MIKITIEGSAASLNDLAVLLSRVVDTVHQIDDTVGLKALRESEPYKFSIAHLDVTLQDTSEVATDPNAPAFQVAPVASPNAKSYISAPVGGSHHVKGGLPKRMKKVRKS